MSIASQAELRETYREPAPRAQQKVLDHIDSHTRDFIALSPFCVISSLGADGRQDTSPRGDPPGFVAVLDERTLLIPDRPGNNQVDSLRNVLAHPEVGLLFLVPGMNETLRVSGRAEIVTDEALLAPLAVGGKAPALGPARHRGGSLPALRPVADPLAAVGPRGADRPLLLPHLRAGAGRPDPGCERRRDRRLRGRGQPRAALLRGESGPTGR